MMDRCLGLKLSQWLECDQSVVAIKHRSAEDLCQQIVFKFQLNRREGNVPNGSPAIVKFDPL